MIDWTKYFDRIWCIHYMPYCLRKAALEFEFNRVGISNHPNFEWEYTFDSPWYDYMFNNIKRDNLNKLFIKNTELKCALAHYSCIKKSLHHNDNRILILEDDERFLKDINLIERILDNMPNDDIVLLDYSFDGTHIPLQKCDELLNSTNSMFSNFDYYINNTGCYSLSKNAICKFAELYDKHLLPSDAYFSKIKYDDLTKCFSKKNICCQISYGKSLSLDIYGKSSIHYVYSKSHLNYDDYMMFSDGHKYNYGDYIE